MRRNVILLVDADVDTYTATLSAAQTAGLDIRAVQIQRDLSEISDFELDDVAAIVLNYDPDIHGRAIGEELPQWLPPRPLIFISSEYGHALMFEGTATRHLTKPASAVQVMHALDAILNHQPAASCDLWGHPLRARSRVCSS